MFHDPIYGYGGPRHQETFKSQRCVLLAGLFGLSAPRLAACTNHLFKEQCYLFADSISLVGAHSRLVTCKRCRWLDSNQRVATTFDLTSHGDQPLPDLILVIH